MAGPGDAHGPQGRESAQARSPAESRRGQIRGESVFITEEDERGIDQVAGAVPSPEFAGQVSEGCRRLLDLLGDRTLRTVAIAKMEGYTSAEIAGQLKVQERTIERKLRIIRELWTKAENL